MNKYYLGAIIILLGITILLFGTYPRGGDQQAGPQGGPRGPNASSTRNLTVRRIDFISNGTQLHYGTNNDQIEVFKVTNHSASTTYRLAAYGFYPGTENGVGPNYVRNLKISSQANLIWQTRALTHGYAPSLSPDLLLPRTSHTFVLTADPFGLPTSTCPVPASTTLEVALGKILATDAISSSTIEPVYKEIDDRLLLPPSWTGADDSVESAIFDVR